MKKYILFLMISILFISLIACSPTVKTTEMHTLETELSQAYDLAELEGFLKNRNATNMIWHSEFDGLLSFNEINEKFPAEVIRYPEAKGGISFPYVVYKVSQGGYYYVFFSYGYPKEMTDNLESELPTGKEYLYVHYSAYINSYKQVSDFMSLKPGVSTLGDLKALDPSMEYATLSRGRFSYSLLNDKEMLEVTYSTKEHTVDDDLVIEDYEVVPIEKTASCFRFVLKEDFP